MLLIIPSIDLQQGRCVRSVLGEPGTEDLYSLYACNPTGFARLVRRENAKAIFITDRDGYFGGDNKANKKQIELLLDELDIPVILMTNFTTEEDCVSWLEKGIYRIVLGSMLFREPELTASLIETYSASRIAFAMRVFNRQVLYPAMNPISETEFADSIQQVGGNRIFYSNVTREATLASPDFEGLQRIGSASGLRITSVGGVAQPSDLWKLQELASFGVDSAVIGRAFYENRFPCQKIWRIAEARLEHQLI
jgi:phosphoribosylformimino-5-aminoimidazole carboxamide ribotide isomerase